jgi:alkylation response protein AidB-like acyl-CoA dehydrogenase
VALAAEQVGGAPMVLDMAVEYAKVRVQFGRPIRSFQAIMHKCVDMLLEVESAKSAASSSPRPAAGSHIGRRPLSGRVLHFLPIGVEALYPPAQGPE